MGGKESNQTNKTVIIPYLLAVTLSFISSNIYILGWQFINFRLGDLPSPLMDIFEGALIRAGMLNGANVVSLSLIMATTLSADNLWKQLGPRSGLKNCQA